MKWAAMLRGINLGKRQLKSAELKAVVEGMGFTEVKTILASGNVVFEASDATPEALEQGLHVALEKATGLKSDVYVRNRADLEALVAANPFPKEAEERPSFLVVTFHRTPPDQAAIDRLLEGYDGPERMVIVGRELFTDFPDGQGRSNLIPAMQKAKLSHANTGRNWNTVLKLLAALS
ncbi:DUF1697 domain-containing protein [Sphingomonas kyeonggiensis]|uniref:Uncharacterized protein (DUF1697 family) n=1 Tax=Sphingomonas kyeonggiensis TaxID=1268553 RepID=A0A7W6JUD8_9SPHN|nr:DUF1697 domain-containing protein [Sphingomonas kyeonggiensis]MBB4099671.1 uncharacterized protein (DUF1697 family) [Sphingomonas kyeonggiensis]